MPEQLKNIISQQSFEVLHRIKQINNIDMRKQTIFGTLDYTMDVRKHDCYEVEGNSLRIATQKGFAQKSS